MTVEERAHAGAPSEELAEKLARLTPREQDCLRLVREGLTSKEIAIRRGLTENTINKAIEAAKDKLGAANRRDAARIFQDFEASAAATIDRLSPLAPSRDPTPREPVEGDTDLAASNPVPAVNEGEQSGSLVRWLLGRCSVEPTAMEIALAIPLVAVSGLAMVCAILGLATASFTLVDRLMSENMTPERALTLEGTGRERPRAGRASS